MKSEAAISLKMSESKANMLDKGAIAIFNATSSSLRLYCRYFTLSQYFSIYDNLMCCTIVHHIIYIHIINRLQWPYCPEFPLVHTEVNSCKDV